MYALIEFFKSLSSFIYLHNYSKKLGKRPMPANEAISQGFNKYVKNREKQSSSKFYLVVKLKGRRPTIIHQKFTNKLWSIETDKVNMFQFFGLIHKDFTNDVVKWGIAAYKLADSVSQEKGFSFSNDSFALTYPMKFKIKNGEFKWMWVYQECFPFEIDENNRIYSHLNEYLILDEFDPKQNRKLFSVIRSSSSEQADIWNKKIREIFQNEELKSFALTKQQAIVFLKVLQNPNLSLEELAHELGGLSKNTISKHTSAILQIIKAVFPDIKRLKEIIQIFKGYEIEDLLEILKYYENSSD